MFRLSAFFTSFYVLGLVVLTEVVSSSEVLNGLEHIHCYVVDGKQEGKQYAGRHCKITSRQFLLLVDV